MPVPGQQSFITVNADGTISYNFDGKIFAKGLDLFAGVSNTPPTDKRIRWLLESDPTLTVSEIFSYFSSGSAFQELRTRNPVSNNATRIFQGSNNIPVAPSDGNVVGVDVQTNGGSLNTRVILNGVNQSSFINAAAGLPRRSATGTVTNNFAASAASNDVTVTHNWNVPGNSVKVYCQVRDIGAVGVSVIPFVLFQTANSFAIRCYTYFPGAVVNVSGNVLVDYIVVEV